MGAVQRFALRLTHGDEVRAGDLVQDLDGALFDQALDARVVAAIGLRR